MEVDLSKLHYSEPAEEPEADNYPEPPTEPLPEWDRPTYEPPAEPEEDRFGQDRKRLELLIQFHINEFPKKLATYKKTNVDDLTMKELKDMLDEMKYTLSAQTNTRMAVQAMTMGITMLEHTAVAFTPLKLKGLSSMCADPDVIDDMKAIALKHMNLANIEPEARLGMRILQQGLMLHNINSDLEKQAAAVKGPQCPVASNDKLAEVEQKYAGL